MAFNEGLKQKIDFLGAMAARRQMQESAEAERQRALQNRLMQEQIKAAEWQNLKDRERQTITLPAGPGLGGMREKQFLDQQAGYISGVSPEKVFEQWQQNFRSGMNAGGGGGGRGGSGYDAAPQQAANPYSYIGPDHSAAPTAEQAAVNLGNLMKDVRTPGVAPGTTVAEQISGEQSNVDSMKNLLGQAGIMENTGSFTEGMLPTQDALNKDLDKLNSEYNTWINTGSTTPPKHWPQEVREGAAQAKESQKDLEFKKKEEADARIKRREKEAQEKRKYYKELYSLPEWRGNENTGVAPIPENIKTEIERILPGFILAAENKGRVPDLRSLINSFKAQAQ